ncbi:MAG TPA: DUF2786 domain-containing protein [Rhodoglobus sp.]|nr:DUF2786 domain-containing protein [Rhodoglobus sp.]
MEDITRKIALLLAKAEDKGCTAEEAEAFYAKAQALASKYQIDAEMIRQRRGDIAPDDKMGSEFHEVPAMYEQAHIALWAEIAKANDVHIFIKPGKPKKICITGYKSDREVVKMLVVSLQIHVLREARAASKAAGGDYYFRRSFIMAFARRIGDRVREQRLNALNTHKSDTGSDMLPALVNKAELAKKAAFAEFDLRSGRARSLKGNSSGAEQGRAAADRADIGNTRIGGSGRAIGGGS